jgi:CheY-like chemotaxis protein/HPt (histidine-containing phosphotransfer) domain-containing protein
MRDMLMLKAEEKHIDFRLNIAPDIPHRLLGDPTRINQILINLAGNAIKFTDHGYVAINVSIERRENSNIWMKFEVTDTGIGIAQDYVDRIFDSFTQAGTDVTRKFGGTGLGLTISKQLISLMHGEINVRSKVGEGTTFTVVLPLEESKVQTSSASFSLVDEQTLKKLNNVKLLLVEDNEFNRMVAEDTLKELLPNVLIDVAVNGQEAVNMVKQQPYDVLLMDIQMPVMDGVEATKLIRETLQSPARDTKIIAMTANVLHEDVQGYFEAGMDAYVSKPFQTDELLLKMANVLEGKVLTAQENKSSSSAAREGVLPPLPAKVTDMQFLKQFTGNKEDKINKYIGMFLENAPRLLKQIDDGVTTKDFPSVKIAAHSLKPQLSYMGVKEETSHIFLIEQTASEAGHSDRLPPLIKNLKRVCEKAFDELSHPEG